ncbi:efflux RND transporter periplasmic adaptor subunit [Actinoplanes sp. NPDC026670]|uniref:efflux RND transporter periplasmic adaptor subunit n=1 Tax=Actinoplanes sp. NPDC026670 TaxID=3154700 RepID=UPI0033F1E388
MRKRILIIVTTGVMALGGAAYTVRSRAGNEPDAVRPSPATAATAEIVRTDLSDYWTETGTVGYRRQRTLRGVAPGVLTWLPKPGRTVARGEVLYRVGDRPVMLLYGSSPMFRDIDTVGMLGRDIRVLADNLRALGYRIGEQPAPGTTVTVQGSPAPGGADDIPEPGASAPEASSSGLPASSYRTVVTARDAVFTATLKDAVKRWQTARGVRPADGTLTLGDVVVLSGAVRVGAAAAQLGDDATGNLMAVSDQAKVVTVDIDASRAGDLRAGQKVRIVLPDSTTTGGAVTSVSGNVQTPSGDGAGLDSPKVQVVIAVDKASTIKTISSADVEVRFAGTARSDVLAVPVGALLALSGGGYGVQISGGSLTAVTVGLFADGMVEITGTGLDAGMRVVTTS